MMTIVDKRVIMSLYMSGKLDMNSTKLYSIIKNNNN